MHYFRFLARSDLSPDTLNSADDIREFPNSWPQAAGDILVYTKRWLGDKSVVCVASLVPESRVVEIQQSFHLPQGVAPKRLISEKVQKKIWRGAPPCLRNGDITREAYDYLVGWSQGLLPEVPRPAQYGILNYRWDSSGGPLNPGTLVIPHRVRTWDLGLDPELGLSDTESSECEADDLPIEDE